ncbi:X-ray repair cross-complementing protein 5 [Linepithema humile]|uniref:X-ray repair cross-complementing protein 5 n=1 Tax=Linepithema humile TaxID=83485 RepID=UPI00351E4573
MPPKKIKENLTFLVNVGTVRHGTQSNSRLLDKAKYIMKHIIKKKILLRPKDEVGVMLMGSGSDNVQKLCNMQVGNWDLIESIEKLETTNQSCSWMEAIYPAVEYMKQECVDNSERKIILLSDFNEDEDIVSQFQADDIASTLSSENVLLIAIGERALNNTDKDSQTASEVLLMDVLQEIDGQYYTFEHTMFDVRFYKRPSTKPMPWSCLMELGDFHIPIIGISKMPTEAKLPQMVSMAKIGTFDTSDQQIKKAVQWTDNNRTVHTKDDTIRGYVYGGKAIPVSNEVKEFMTPKTSERCYKIHGFTARENVPMEYWLSDGSYIIVPANESASAPFYSLMRAMVEKKVVAIVEKVYRKNLEANMVALFPSTDVPNEPWCFIEIGLPFERDYGAIAQRPLKFMMKQLSKEQSDAMDDLLTSLELPDADDDPTGESEKYLPGYMPDPGAQHMWDMLSARALNPDKPLPPVADDIKNLLEQPEFVREKCKPVAERIKDLFSLEKKKPLKAKKRGRSREEDNTQSDNNGDTLTTQSAKEEEKNIDEDDDDESNNMKINDICDFDFDEVMDDA